MKWLKTGIKKPELSQIIDLVIDNQDILITNINDKLIACKDLCPHEEVKISLGCIQNSRLRCSLHGFSFDLTTGECNNADVENLQLYAVKQENNEILVKI